ncbi:hypothetical protein [Thalassospira lohafexi]|uniref:Uncharacterized protein n=1 Tax=Thalassospira lohafexi TaxID=744227 RepID=A0A2N3L0N2_9PROT|nr:hypothetical protein [Thalassospira lohafexi]PKR56375.1 hypothetical protein COO92_21460 [Thalassospira lohafexi]
MTEVSKHTPGPWVFYADTPSVEPNWNIITNGSRQFVVANIHIEAGNERDEANAHLIAAAPDLLDVCKAVFDDVASIDNESCLSLEVGRALKAAIAKAEGGAS